MADATKAQNLRARKLITQERLKELLHYDSETGLFRWIIDVWGGSGLSGKPPRIIVIPRGEIAGCRQECRGSYIFIRLDGVLYPAHRLAWFYMTGEWPARVDHRDTIGTNNEWKNLRLATRSQNAANSKMPIDNTSGFKGVHFSQASQKWCAMIRVDGKTKYLGIFEEKADAALAYAEGAAKYFGEFART